MILIAETKVYELGQYTIRKQPLFDNPYWATHVIFHQGEIIGRQLSVPTESDCDWYRATKGRYAAPTPWRQAHPELMRNSRRGRPRKEDARRMLEEAIAA